MLYFLFFTFLRAETNKTNQCQFKSLPVLLVRDLRFCQTIVRINLSLYCQWLFQQNTIVRSQLKICNARCPQRFLQRVRPIMFGERAVANQFRPIGSVYRKSLHLVVKNTIKGNSQKFWCERILLILMEFTKCLLFSW